MLKTIVKTTVAAALSRSGVNAFIRNVAPRPLVLGYHAVVEDVRAHAGRAIPANLISVGMLERQLDWIGRRYRFLSLDELGARLESGAPLDKPSAVVTFDDGYAGVYHHAWPLLRRKGIPAAAFVVTDLLGSGRLQIYDKLYLALSHVLPRAGYSPAELETVLRRHRLDAVPLPPADRVQDVFAVMRHFYTHCDQGTLRRVIEALETVERVEDGRYPEMHPMTWAMAAALDRNGVAIGSHTRTHALLTREEPALVTDELLESSRALQRRLRRPVFHFAYPDGRFDPDVVAAVAQAGYRFAYTTCAHRDPGHPTLTIPRTLLWERSCLDGWGRFSADLMSCHASPIWNRWAGCRHGRRAAGAQAPGSRTREIGACRTRQPHEPVAHV